MYREIGGQTKHTITVAIPIVARKASDEGTFVMAKAAKAQKKITIARIAINLASNNLTPLAILVVS
ncbi:MAG: hypothetical protein ACUZ8I_07200 [Candidatus Scalindua sp.]